MSTENSQVENLSQWAQLAERGSGLGLRFVFVCRRLLGARLTALLLYPIVLYFFMTGSVARGASQKYLQRLRAHSLPTLDCSWRASFRHLYAFATAAVDKLAAWSGQLDGGKVDFPQRAMFDELQASGRGAIIVASHLGNIEMMRALAAERGVARINAVLYTNHAQRFNRILAHANASFGASLIEVSSMGPDTAILLQGKVEQGEILVIMGDRIPPIENGRTVDVDFLGAPARFAIGPWILANLLDCPVYLFFALPKVAGDGDGFCIHMEQFAERIALPRKDRQEHLQALAQRYADRLAHYCALAPLQWFNFFDFWQREPHAKNRPDPS